MAELLGICRKKSRSFPVLVGARVYAGDILGLCSRWVVVQRLSPLDPAFADELSLALVRGIAASRVDCGRATAGQLQEHQQ